MSITLRFLDMREDPTVKKPPEYRSEIPFPATRLSVYVAAEMTLKRAREKGYKGRSERYVVLLKEPGEQFGYALSPDKAKNIFVPDGATVTVSGEREKSKRKVEVWQLD